MPELTFDISKGDFTNPPADEIDLQEFLKATLHDLSFKNKKPYDDIIPSLLDFHKADGGSPEIPKFEIIDCSYDSITYTGTVQFAYEVFFTFGCADIYRSDKCTETCKFQIDTENQKLTLFITDQITRDTVDEF
ncbi:MAG TPA: hypothetical protein DCO83_11575 [Mucilaginibacter sp.]|jgi:hypothetical protein|nr:hypothetical protein [Mucilaginibacter sp.]